jgi:hypothetical protein
MNLTAWQIVEIVAEESDERAKEITIADKARVRWTQEDDD